MTVNKLTSPISQNDLINKTNEIIDNLGGGTVDQTYDPTSANAQSGVAIAGVLEDKQDVLTAGSFITIGEYRDFSTPIKNANLGSNNWNAITYGDNKFVALGSTGYISTSTDGVTWTTAIQNANLGSHSWQSLTYGNGVFVALGYKGYISTSSDGTTWTTATQNTNLGSNSWGAVAYGDGKFVATGHYGYISTSTDGINWTTATQNANLSGSTGWSNITYGDGKFVAVTSSGIGHNGYSSVSVDGISWSNIQIQPSALTYSLGCLSFDGVNFEILSYFGKSSSSANGIDWDTPQETFAYGRTWSAIAYGNSKLVALNDNGYITTSENSKPIISIANSCFDGQFTGKRVTDAISQTAIGSYSYSLSSYLPSDQAYYIVYGQMWLISTASTTFTVGALASPNTNITSNTCYAHITASASGATRDYISFAIPIQRTSTTPYIYAQITGTKASSGCHVDLIGYRRIGANT